MRQPVLDVAVDHHATLSGQVARENDVRLSLGYRGGGFQQKRSDREASRALVRRIFVLVAGGVIKLLARGVDENRDLESFRRNRFRDASAAVPGI